MASIQKLEDPLNVSLAGVLLSITGASSAFSYTVPTTFLLRERDFGVESLFFSECKSDRRRHKHLGFEP
jgi:hypothetical protein